jgi:hypothetical protein
MKKNLNYRRMWTVVFTTALLPFLLVWIAFLMTGFSFTPREVFQSSAFWCISFLYWTLWVCMIGFIADAVLKD